MKKFYFYFLLFVLTGFLSVNAQENNEIRLLVRGDDIGSFHAANLACIKSYTDGIMRSVEIMVPCAWFPEAVIMLKDNPDLDVGIHLVMTSEWQNTKWRPLTGMSTITDKDGYFFPMVWPNDNYPPEMTFRESGWLLEDVEKELRAQIEVAVKNIANVSHLSSHMGFGSADPLIDELIEKLAKEYGLNIETTNVDFKRLQFRRDKNQSFEDQAFAFAEAIKLMEPGTYMFVEHPAYDTPEMETVGHEGYFDVGRDREGVTYILTSELVKQALIEKGVKLISYQDL